MGKAHIAAIRGNSRAAMELMDEGRRVFDTAGSDDAESDYAVPWWRFNVFISLMTARLGVERLALQAQDEAGSNPAGVAASVSDSSGDAPRTDARARRRS